VPGVPFSLRYGRQSLTLAFDMRAIILSGKRRAPNCAATLRLFLMLAAVGTVLAGTGCATPYSRRLDELEQAYQRGDLSHEDFNRFVREAEWLK
jgi:hypothetical protein